MGKRKQEPKSRGRRKVKAAHARTQMDEFNSPKRTAAKTESPRAGLLDGYVTELELAKPGRRARRLADGATGRVLHGPTSGLQKYYSIQSIAQALDVSPRTVRRWIANGDLIATRINRVVRISDADLRAMLALSRYR
jgi:excisionase family DNA binding protein